MYRYHVIILKSEIFLLKKYNPIRLNLYICAHKYKEIIIIDKMIYMKNVHCVIDGVLSVAVVILFVLHFTGNKNADNSTKTAISSSEEFTSNLPLAYFDADSLLERYFFSIDLNEQILKKREDASAYLTQQARNFQSSYESFQYRLQNNAFATQQRAEQEAQRLQRQQQELQETEEKMQMELMEEIQRVNMQMRDTIVNHLNEYNQMKHYHIIFSTGSSNTVNPIVVADNVYNITGEVIEFLNKKWISK